MATTAGGDGRGGRGLFATPTPRGGTLLAARVTITRQAAPVTASEGAGA
ncbi:MAG: hypothetical protein ACLGIN_18810 [Candidatus Sericytochromatia bacterium]